MPLYVSTIIRNSFNDIIRPFNNITSFLESYKNLAPIQKRMNFVALACFGYICISLNNTTCNKFCDYIGIQILKNLTPFQKKVTVLTLAGFSLAIVSFFTYRCFFTNKMTEGPTTAYYSAETKQAQKEVQALIGKGDMDAAWLKYLSTACDCNSPPSIYNLASHNSWHYLPPEILVKEFLDRCATSNGILKFMPARFIRDCSLVFPEIRNRLLTEDPLWECFTGYPEYIVDICIKNEQFAKNLILSPRSKINLDDKSRLVAFEAAYRSIEEAFYKEEVNIQEMKYFSLFLFNYRSPIDKRVFDKIKKIEQLTKDLAAKTETKFNTECHILMDTLISKLNAQGIYDSNGIYDARTKTFGKSKLVNSDEIEDFIDTIQS